VSTTIAASRRGRYTVAVSNIFGSNSFDIVLLLLADVLYRQGTVFAHGAASLTLVAAIGAAMTCIYLWGLLERDDRAVARLGYDSIAALVVYLAGVAVLYLVT
jgi:cation:H+ antiporter